MLFLVPNRQNVHQLSICHNACFQSGSFPLPSLSQTQGSGSKKEQLISCHFTMNPSLMYAARSPYL